MHWKELLYTLALCGLLTIFLLLALNTEIGENIIMGMVLLAMFLICVVAPIAVFVILMLNLIV